MAGEKNGGSNKQLMTNDIFHSPLKLSARSLAICLAGEAQEDKGLLVAGMGMHYDAPGLG